MLAINIYTNTLSALTAKLSGLLKEGEVYKRAMEEVAFTSCEAVRNRIHEDGRAADGSDIGKYSTSPVYVNVTAAVGGGNLGQPVGKTGRSVFAGGKKKGQNHKTAYLAGGYAQYKQAIGKSNGKVNLVLSGEMSEQFEVMKTGEGFGLGWDSADMLSRALALEDKYGKTIWGLTGEEKLNAVETAQTIIHDAIS